MRAVFDEGGKGLLERIRKWISAELHLGTWTQAASQVAKLKTEPKEQNEFRLE
jgi:hypothetical protein